MEGEPQLLVSLSGAAYAPGLLGSEKARLRLQSRIMGLYR